MRIYLTPLYNGRNIKGGLGNTGYLGDRVYITNLEYLGDLGVSPVLGDSRCSSFLDVLQIHGV